MSSPEKPNTRVSLRDIAKELGISHVSVSLALRDSPRISKQRKEQVQEAAKRMGYTPDPMLSALANYRQQKDNHGVHSALAWINQWDDKDQLRSLKEFDAYWHGASDTATKLGFRLEEFRLTENLSGSRLFNIFKTRNIRGILIPPHPRGIELEGFDWSQFSIVRFGYSVRQSKVHLVTSEMVANAMLAYQKMQENGYERIGLVAHETYDTNTRHNIRAGFKAAEDIHSNHEKPIPILIFRTNNFSDKVSEMKQWIDKYQPDAILNCSSEVKEILEQLNIRVPEDIGVAVTSVLDAQYDTGIDQRSYEIGRVAVSKLAGLIHENETGLPQTIRRTAIEGVWIQGKSLPPKGSLTKD